LAGMLIDAASGAGDWQAYRDQAAQEIRSLLETKLQGQPAAAEPVRMVLPLLEALQQSVAVATPANADVVPVVRRQSRAPRKRTNKRTA
jgi:non-homologous end joining protein Ku